MEKFNTFWSLIENNKVEIPAIQRDYTYGREKAIGVCRKLLKSIFDILSSDEDKSLHLDFIYGKLVGKENLNFLSKNKQNINMLLNSVKVYAEKMNISIDYDEPKLDSEPNSAVTFIPLDGQQRLTTLFLVHWYIANNLKSNDARKLFKKFSYSTRASSKEFLLMLVEFDLTDRLKGRKLSEEIKNSEHFYSFWKKDPTVKSMLAVIDMIDEQFQNIDFENSWHKLTVQNQITFDFFDLESFNQTDELYVKMNARGKSLTSFENFKSWLVKSDLSIKKVLNWKNKLDVKWNDLFWNLKKKNETEIDPIYLSFFKTLFLGDYLNHDYETDQLPSDENKFINLLRISEGDQSNQVIELIELFEKEDLFRKNIEKYLIILENLASKKFLHELSFNPEFIGFNLGNFIINGEGNKTWWTETLFYAITRYIHTFSNEIIEQKNDLVKQWVRVISNLIFNSSIDSPGDYQKACNSIDAILKSLADESSLSICEWLKSQKAEDIIFFSNRQKDEEIKKAKLICDAPERWEKQIVDLELHKYFYGQIGFVLHLANDSQTFTAYSKKLKVLFSETVLEDDTNLLFRAIIAQVAGDNYQPFFIKGNTFTFPSNERGTLRVRTENWRKFYNNLKSEFEPKINYLSNLIAAIPNDCSESQILEILNEKVKSFESNNKNLLAIVKTPYLLNYASKNTLRLYDKGLYILSTSRIYGYYAEVLTYNWYLKNKAMKGIQHVSGSGIEYLDSTGVKIGDKLIYLNHKLGIFQIESSQIEYDDIEELIKKELNHAITN